MKAMKAVIVREMTFRDRIPHEDLDRLAGNVEKFLAERSATPNVRSKLWE